MKVKQDLIDPDATFSLGFDEGFTQQEAPRRRTPEEIKLAQKLREFLQVDIKTDAMRERHSPVSKS